MCGILGLINIGSRDILDESLKLISHRGPDDTGTVWFKNLNSGLGHKRLSIIDLSRDGHQPMANSSKRYWITYNGEIYNYKEIKKELKSKGYVFASNSDTEVVLKSYEEWGENCLTKFNGIFAFAIFDTFTSSLFAARDRIGVKPFYYYHSDSKFIFSSEIKSILKTGLVNVEPDIFALHTPTRFQISPFTGFKNILKLPPGHFLYFKNGKLEITRYWAINPTENDTTVEEAIQNLDTLLNSSVKLQMVSDVEVGSFLSGGIDSSLISRLMIDRTNKPIKTFTIKFRKNDRKFEKMPDDSYYAKKMANLFNFSHHEFEINPDIVELLPKLVWHLDEPLSDPAAINTYLISKAAREMGIYVLLNGMGGDEIFGGYRKQYACLKADLINTYIPSTVTSTLLRLLNILPVASKNKGYKWFRWGKRFASFASLPRPERYFSSDLSPNPYDYDMMFFAKTPYWDTHFYNSQIPNFQNNLSYLTQMCLNDTLVFLPEHNLTYSDRATMAAGVESRPPFTDHRIIEYMFSLSPSLRIRGQTQKYLLRKVASKYLPKEIVNRPKAPFGSPLRSWIRGPLKDLIDDYLSENTIKKRGIYNHRYIKEKISNDRKGYEDNAHLIWQFLTTEIWFRTFFDKKI